MELEAQKPAADAKRVGEQMPKADWQEAINLLKAKAPAERGRVYLPKEGGEYGGQLLLVTDTHLVQRVGRGTAVAHDLGKLDGGTQLAADFEAGKLKLGNTLRITYGSEHEKGQATVVPFNQQRAAEIKRDLSDWAATNITNSRGRESFLKHLDAATRSIADKPPAQRPAPAAAPERTQSPTKDR
jgi:hypothetical protein